MPDFAYTARDGSGSKVVGQVSAATEKEAASILAGKALFPLELSAKRPARQFGFSRRVGGQLMATTFGQMAGLLRSGVPLLRSIQVLFEQTSNTRLEAVLKDVHTRVEDGATLAEGMARHQDVFGDMAVSMVRAGGEGGFLEDALDRIATFTELREDLKSRTIGALAYPCFLAVMLVLIVTALLVFFVPGFEEMFDELNRRGELPGPTIWLLALSSFLSDWWWALLIAFVAALVVLRVQLQTDRGRRLADLAKLKVPLAGPILQNLAVARFCRVLGTMLANGVPILTALDISRQAAGNRVLSEAVAEASENITAGQSLSGPLTASGHFPKMVVEMIAVAEQSNSLDRVLVEIADGLERRTVRRLDLAVRLLEPIMLLILAGAVLTVAMALLLPMLKMNSMIQ